MIYDFPEPAAPIQQGDIFRSIPRIDAQLAELPVLDEDGSYTTDWRVLAEADNPTTAIVAMRPVYAIVITQDCDAVRIDDIALCEIQRFELVEPSAMGAKYPAKSSSTLTIRS